MSALAAGVVGAATAGLLGAAVPALVRRLPEPHPDPDPVPGEPPKEPYADLAARPRLLPACAAVSAAAGALVGSALGWDPALVGLVPLLPVGVALAFVDWRTRLLPSRIVLPATAAVVVLGLLGWAVTGDHADLVRATAGLLAVRSCYWLLWRVHATGMGFGDVRLAALLGFVLGHLGWGPLLVGTYAPFLIFGLPGLLLAVVRRDRSLLRTAYPFGPAMLAGALVGVVAGERILAGLVSG